MAQVPSLQACLQKIYEHENTEGAEKETSNGYVQLWEQVWTDVYTWTVNLNLVLLPDSRLSYPSIPALVGLHPVCVLEILNWMYRYDVLVYNSVPPSHQSFLCSIRWQDVRGEQWSPRELSQQPKFLIFSQSWEHGESKVPAGILSKVTQNLTTLKSDTNTILKGEMSQFQCSTQDSLLRWLFEPNPRETDGRFLVVCVQQQSVYNIIL